MILDYTKWQLNHIRGRYCGLQFANVNFSCVTTYMACIDEVDLQRAIAAFPVTAGFHCWSIVIGL